MIDNAKDYITYSPFEYNWRFEGKECILENIDVLDEKINEAIWYNLKNQDIIKNYALNQDKFDRSEEFQFKHDYSLVKERLRKLKSGDEKVILTWASGPTILVNFKVFVENWKDFYYPSSDDIVVVNNHDWIIYLSHFESIQVGENLKNKTCAQHTV